MNKDRRIWRTNEDVGSGLLVSRPRQQKGIVADLVRRPRQQTMSADHVSKYTWHNQVMTSVKRKLARAMSTSDVSKLRHSGRIASGVSPPRNVKSPEVPKDEGPKSLSVVDLRYYPDR
jgi:hypothetical protein